MKFLLESGSILKDVLRWRKRAFTPELYVIGDRVQGTGSGLYCNQEPVSCILVSRWGDGFDFYGLQVDSGGIDIIVLEGELGVHGRPAIGLLEVIEISPCGR